jgi:hypothetical protein
MMMRALMIEGDATEKMAKDGIGSNPDQLGSKSEQARHAAEQQLLIRP